MAERHKINWLLILQGWAMLWVVIGHSGPSATYEDYPEYAWLLHSVAYSFHMSLFIGISGFLFYLTRIDNERWTYWLTMKEKIVRFGIPFVFFTLVALVMKSVFAGSVDRGTTLSIREFVNAILFPFNGPMREFWFLATILWYFALFPIWKVLLRYNWLTIMALVGLAVLSVRYPDCDFLAIRQVCRFAFFFFGGIICAKLYKQNNEYIYNIGTSPILILVGAIIYITGMVWSIPLITPISGCFLSLALALWLDKRFPNTFFSFRDYTYQIYLMGIFFNVICTILRAKFGLPFVPMQVFSLLLALYIPVLVSKVIEWINWKPLLLCVGLKPIKNKI